MRALALGFDGSRRRGVHVASGVKGRHGVDTPAAHALVKIVGSRKLKDPDCCDFTACIIDKDGPRASRLVREGVLRGQVRAPDPPSDCRR